MARIIAYATSRTVSLYEGSRRLTYKHGDYADEGEHRGTTHGVNLDLAGEALEGLGYEVNSGASWRWHGDSHAREIDAYKAVAIPIQRETPAEAEASVARIFADQKQRQEVARKRRLGMW